jgi:hypothetical protein
MPPAGRWLLHSWWVGLALGRKRYTVGIPTAMKRNQAMLVPAVQGQFEKAALLRYEASLKTLLVDKKQSER